MKKAIIIGAGPAGLTAAYELLKTQAIKPIIFEKSGSIGGLAKTLYYKGNGIDIGPHRYFSKSATVTHWWLNILPLLGKTVDNDTLSAQSLAGPNGATSPLPISAAPGMLLKNRSTRILYLGKFYDYPVSLSFRTLANFGFIKTLKIGASYGISRLNKREEKSLEDFMINQFGRELYNSFFKSYTEKVWGIPPAAMPPDWGRQRIQGVSVLSVLLHAIQSALRTAPVSGDHRAETSLIKQFMYPQKGSGQIWEEAARHVERSGGEIAINKEIIGIAYTGNTIRSVVVRDTATNTVETCECDYLLSSMPVKDLIAAMGDSVPEPVKRAAGGLIYRNIVIVGLLLKELTIKNRTAGRTSPDTIEDNWMYIQEPGVKVGRLQIYNNWSSAMLADENTVWIGLEYYCGDDDILWRMPPDEMKMLAIDELVKIGIISKEQVLDGVVIKEPKAYPAYFGAYQQFGVIKGFVGTFENLYLIGRNGMHRYNNLDHATLTAMAAVDNINTGVPTKESIWAINTEQRHLETTPAAQKKFS
jgi:protoporphyrinogen oxidase